MCHICTDLYIIFVQTYVSYLHRLTCHIEIVEIDSTGTEYNDVMKSLSDSMDPGRFNVKYIYRIQNRKLWSQTYISYLYRLMCHICIDLHVIFVQTYMSYL
jgi:hypothetical protein